VRQDRDRLVRRDGWDLFAKDLDKLAKRGLSDEVRLLPLERPSLEQRNLSLADDVLLCGGCSGMIGTSPCR